MLFMIAIELRSKLQTIVIYANVPVLVAAATAAIRENRTITSLLSTRITLSLNYSCYVILRLLYLISCVVCGYCNPHDTWISKELQRISEGDVYICDSQLPYSTSKEGQSYGLQHIQGTEIVFVLQHLKRTYT